MRRNYRDLCEKYPVVTGNGEFRRGYEPTIPPNPVFRGMAWAILLESLVAAGILIAARWLGWF